MIYTVGRDDIYIPLLENYPDVEKDVDGSVWQTLEEVEDYLVATSQQDRYSIYGVDADWDTDTVVIEGSAYRSLTRKAGLIVR